MLGSHLMFKPFPSSPETYSAFKLTFLETNIKHIYIYIDKKLIIKRIKYVNIGFGSATPLSIWNQYVPNLTLFLPSPKGNDRDLCMLCISSFNRRALTFQPEGWLARKVVNYGCPGAPTGFRVRTRDKLFVLVYSPHLFLITSRP